MSRRRHQRFKLVPPPEGVLRKWRDVVVSGPLRDEVSLLSREQAVLGEVLTIEVRECDVASQTVGRVVESHPVMINGTVWHRVRLAHVSGPARSAKSLERSSPSAGNR